MSSSPSLPWRLLHLLALSTMAITQPLLGLLGDNPTFFTAHQAGAGEVVGFALVVALGPALVAAAVEVAAHLVDAGLGRRIHVALVAGLTFLFVVQVVDVVPGPWIVVAAVAAAATLGLVWVYVGHEPVRTAVSVLGATPVLFVGLFVFVSPASSVVFPDAVAAVALEDLVGTLDAGPTPEPTVAGVPPRTIEERVADRFPPIFVLVLDEVPMASLLDDRGEIDAARWPNFARLAATSHLFANTTTVAFTTERAVPAILTGSYELAAAPVYSLYPRNLFTLLGDIYDVSSADPLVDLCPPSVCNGTPPSAMLDLLANSAPTVTAAATTVPPTTAPSTTAVPPSTAPTSSDPTGRGAGPLRQLLDDAAIVFGHLATPDGLDIGLPEIGAGWGDFGRSLDAPAPTPTTTTITTTTPTTTAAAPAPTTVPLAVEVGAEPPDEIVEVDPDAINREIRDHLDALITDDTRVAQFRADVAAITDSPVPRLHYLHPLLPHVPWRLHGNGEIYADIELPGYFSSWDDDPIEAAFAQQRHLLQLQFTDHLLGEYLDRLEATGILDRALVVVTADHGVSFVAGSPSRGVDRDNLGGVAGVPLFVKLPDQTTGRRHAEPVETVDIVATIAAQLGIEIPWAIDGRDLFGPSMARDRAVRQGFATPIPEPFEETIGEVTGDLLATFGDGTDGSLYALAGLTDRIGDDVTDLAVAPATSCWSRSRPSDIPDADGTTGYVFGRMTAPGPDPIDYAIVVDGVLAGTARTLDGARHGVYALADPQYWAGASIDTVSLHEIIDGRLAPIPSC